MKSSVRITLRHTAIMITALLLGVVPILVGRQHVLAGSLGQRGVAVGVSTPGATTSHSFNFDTLTGGNLGSIAFEYCDNSPMPAIVCNAPAGLDVTGAVLAGQTGQTGFSVAAGATANRVVITRPVTSSTAGPLSYSFDGIINPTTPKSSIFVRISTYSSTNATTGLIDFGAVVFSTSGGLGAQGFVPPFLTFCVGITVAIDCSSSTGNFIDFGELSTTAPRLGTLQFSGATNVDIGYVISFTGTGLTSGNNVIPSPAAATVSNVGTSQFGFNLRANSSPAIGSNPVGNGSAVPTANYNTPNKFMLLDGDTVAISTITTDFTRFTASYIVNINKDQKPGVYSTTNTFIATAQF